MAIYNYLFISVTLLCIFGVNAENDTPTRSWAARAKGIFDLGSGSACLSADRSQKGVCLSRQQCALQGGKVAGYCGVFSTCCALAACDIKTNAKSVVFSNPPLTPLSHGLECFYNIEINNPRVCQLRIDMEIFSLAQPNTTIVTTTEKFPGWNCLDDVFQVTNLQAFSEIIPSLCGDNSGQHLYVRVNASLNQRAIRINFKIADRTEKFNLPLATWRIRVTQLECHNTLGLYKEPNYLDILTSNLPVTDEIKLHERSLSQREPKFISTADRDLYLIAPDGCLQYFPDRSGTFESFNYNRGLGPYMAGLHYATCFKRTPDVCGIKLTASKFVLAFNDKKNSQLDTDCQTNPYVVGSLDSQDYFYIPEGETIDGLRGSKWCGTSAQGKIIASTPPGPLYVFFNSDNVFKTDSMELGYRINYNVLNNC